MFSLALSRMLSLVLPLALLLLAGCAVPASRPPAVLQAATAPAYDYPVDNPYAATIIGTPAEHKVEYDNKIKLATRALAVFPDRKIPEGFWYYRDGLLYGERLQDHAAPLVYIIGGTGSGHLSSHSVMLAQMLYAAGNHVVTLPSPTHANFIVTAGGNHFPGNAEDDARDLYRAMRLIKARIAEKAEITAFGVTG